MASGTIGDSATNGSFLNLGVTGSTTGFPVTGLFNQGTSTVNAKVWVGTATTTSGQATFYPTTTGTSSGTAVFSTILSVQPSALLQSTNAASLPAVSLYSVSTTAIVVSVIVAYSGARVANGTSVYLLVIGT